MISRGDAGLFEAIENKQLTFFTMFSSVVTKNELELLLTLTKHYFNYLFIILRHPGTFSKKNFKKDIPE